MDEEKKEVLNETPQEPKKKKKKGLLIGIISAAAVLAIAAVVLLVTGVFNKGSDDEWLRKALAEDSVRTIELNEDIKCTEGYEVNGTKTLVGNGKISMVSGGNYALSVNEGASLTVDGITLNAKNTCSNGVVVRAGGKLVWESGTISYPKQYAVISYGDATINGGTFEYAGTSWLYVKANTSAVVNGGSFVKSGAAGFDIEDGATLTITGNTQMERAGTNTINNNGSLVVTGGTISQCETWTITNHGDADISNLTVKDCSLKGTLYNYKDATAVLDNCTLATCKTYHIYNEGVCTVKNTTMSDSNASSINNKNEITIENCTILNSNYHGIYNERGTVNIKNLTVDGTVYKAVQNKDGYVTIDGLTTANIGGVGVGNVAVSAGGDYGWIHAKNMNIQGCTDYDLVSYGGEVTVEDSTFGVTPATPVYIRNGTADLSNIVIEGSSSAGKAGLACGSKEYRTSVVTLSGSDTKISGCSRGITNYGKLTMKDGLITGNTTSGDQEVGGGVYNVGTFYLYGGTITGNTSTSYGGGVRNGVSEKHYGVMYMYGGTISNNYSGSNGGGISIGSAQNAVYMYGGTVTNNTAADKGNGIMVGGTFVYNGGTISNNDVFLYENGNYIDVKAKSINGTIEVNSNKFDDTGFVVAKFADDATAASLASKFVSANDQWSFTQSTNTLVTKVALNDITDDTDFSGAKVVVVDNFQALKKAVESTTGTKIIKVAANIGCYDTITVPAGASVKLIDDGTARTLVRDNYSGVLFEVPGSATLYMAGSAGLTVDGNSAAGTVASAPLVKVTYNGFFELQSGAVLANAVNTTYDTNSRAAAINLYGGRGIIDGGIITNCNASGKDPDTGSTENLAAIYVSTSAVISIKSGTITNCSNGVMRSYGRVYMSGGTIANNSRTGDGGTAVRACMMVMSGGTISGNTSSNSGNAIYITKSSAYPNPYFKMTGGTITGNKSERTVSSNSSAGAVYIGENGTFDMTAGTISNNVAGSKTNPMSGGAIYADLATVNIGSGAVISKNTAYNSAGGIYCAGCTLNIADGATISGNKSYGVTQGYGSGGAIMLTSKKVTENTGRALTFTDADGTIKVATAAKIGGASIINNESGNSGTIYVDAHSTLNMSNTKVTNNKTTGISTSTYASGSAIMNKSKVTMTNCTISGNIAQGQDTASNYKAAIYNDGKDATLTISGGTISNNTANGAAAVCNATGTATLTGVTISGNTAIQPDSSSTTGGNGGAVMNQSSGTMTLKNCTLSNNTATVRTADGKGGEGGAVYNDAGTLTIDGCTFSGNSARIGIDVLNSSSAQAFTLNGKVTFSSEEGAIYLAKNRPITLGSSLTSGSSDKISVTLASLAVGNQVFDGDITNTKVNLFDLQLATKAPDEYINLDNGMLWKDGTVLNVVCKIGDQSYYSLDSALSEAEDGDTIVIVNDIDLTSTVTVNKAVTIKTDETKDYTIKSSGITSGYMFKVTAAAQFKGTASSQLIIDGNSSGCAIMQVAKGIDSTLEYVTMQNANNSNQGGAVQIPSGTGTVTFKNCVLQNNTTATTSNAGGAIFVGGGRTAVLTNCQVLNNTATGHGGAFMLSTSSGKTGKMTLTNCTVSGNKTTNGYGSVVYATQTGGVPTEFTATNTTFSNNSYEGSSQTANGVIRTTGKYTVTGCTFSGNYGYDIYDNSTSAFGSDVKTSTFDKTKANAIWKNANSSATIESSDIFAPSYVAMIGTTGYETMDAALAAAQDGDTITLKEDCTVSISVPAGKTITLSGAYTVTGAASVSGTLNLVDTVISGNAAVEGTLGVSGASAVTNGKVTLSDTGVIAVSGTLSAAQVATVTNTTAGTQILSGSASDVSANVARFTLDTSDPLIVIGDDGIVAALSYVAKIGTVEYTSLDAALSAANTGDVIELEANVAGVTVNKNVTLTGDYKLTGTTTVADGVTVTVKGGISADNIALGTGSLIGVDGALTGTFGVTSSAAAGTQVLTGTTADITAAYDKFTLDSTTNKVGSDGTIQVIGEAKIGDVTYTTLEAAVAAATAGQTITIIDDVEIETSITLSNAITITTDGVKDRTIKSSGISSGYMFVANAEITWQGSSTSKLILDGAQSGCSILQVGSYNGTFDNVILQNAKDGNQGGAIQMKSGSGTLTFTNSILQNNETTKSGASTHAGGAIFVGAGRTVNMTNCQVLNNKAAGCGGAFTLSTASSSKTVGKVTLTDCTVSGNTTTGGLGAVVYGTQTGGVPTEFTATNTTFTNNTYSTSNNGAIRTTGKYTITGCTFNGNNGYDIYDNYGTAFSGTSSVTGSTFDKSRSEAIYKSASSTADIAASNTFVEYAATIGTTNYTTLAAALAAAQDGDTIVLNNDCSEDITVETGKTLTLSGAYTVTGTTSVAGTLNLEDSTLSGNVTVNGVLGMSGAAAVTTGKVTLAGTGNIAVSGTLSAATAATIVTPADGTAVLTGSAADIAANKDKFQLDTTNPATIIGNDGIVTTLVYVAKIGTTEYTSLTDALTAANAGDVIELEDNLAGITFNKDVTVTGDYSLTGTTTVSDGVTLTVKGGISAANIALGTGSLIGVDGTLSGTFGVTTSAAVGTQVLTGTAADITANYNAFTLSSATNYIYADGTIAEMGEAKIGTVTYTTLEAAIVAANAGDTVTLISDATVDTALTIDKAITLTTDGVANRTITTTVVDDYAINVTAAATLQGAGESSKLILDGQNTDRSKVMLYCSAATTLQNVEVKNVKNTADKGGAVYVNGAALTISNASFTNNVNTANVAGGAIFINGDGTGSLTASDVTFSGNSCYSGPVTFNTGTTGDLTDCTFTGNTARNVAGAVYVGGAKAVVTMTNCVADSNTAGGKYGGGAVYIVTDAKLNLIGGKMTNNTATTATAQAGGAIWVAQSSSTKCGYLVADGVLFSGNSVTGTTAANNGNAIYGTGVYSLTDCAFINNTGATYDCAVGNANSSYKCNGTSVSRSITNCIFDDAESSAAGSTTSGGLATVTMSGNIFAADISSISSALPEYENGNVVTGLTDNNGETLVYIIPSTKLSSAVTEYGAVLTSEGYTQSASNAIDGNHFATYTKSGEVVSLAATKNGRLTVSKDTTAAVANTAYTPTGAFEPSVTMVGVQDNTSSDTIEATRYGMDLIFQLDDGSFIVVDGGYEDGVSAVRLYNKLVELKGDTNITIAAWILTHSHNDHVGCFVEFSSNYPAVTVEEVITNFPGTAEYTADTDSNTTYLSKVNSVLSGAYSGVTQITARAGQTIQIRDASITVLYTYDLAKPATLANINESSLVFTVELGGKKTLVLGDASQVTDSVLRSLYSTALKSDILQTAHHGYTSRSVSSSLYEAVAPTYVLWPASETAYNANTSNASNIWINSHVAAANIYIAKAGSYTLNMSSLNYVPAATVNGTPYDSLSDAVSAANDGDTVILSASANQSGITYSKSITITSDSAVVLSGNATVASGKTLALSNNVSGGAFILEDATASVTGTNYTGYTTYTATTGKILMMELVTNAAVINENAVASYDSLETAVDESVEGDVLALIGNVNMSTNLKISKAITLTTDGQADYTISSATRAADTFLVNITAGAKILGSSSSRIIIDGRDNGTTAATYNRGVVGLQAANIQMDYVTVQNGTTGYTYGGAGVYANKTGIVLNNCVIQNNTTTTTSGSPGGAIYLTSAANVTMNSTSILNNRSERYGGAGTVASSASAAGTLTLNDCTVSGNSAKSVGGAFYVMQSGGTSAAKLVASNTTFISNSSDSGNGGVLRATGAFELTGCTFTGNSGADADISEGNTTAYTRTITNCTFDKTEGNAHSGSVATVTGCTFAS